MSIELVIVTPEGEAFSGPVEQVVLPGAEGEFGVLEQHERLLAPLQHGAVQILQSGGSQWAAVSNGFADVGSERVVVLADFCQLAGEIDIEAARQARTDAQAELATLGEDEDAARRADLEEQIRAADVQIEVAEK